MDFTGCIYSGVAGALVHGSQVGCRTVASRHLYLTALLGQPVRFLHMPTFQVYATLETEDFLSVIASIPISRKLGLPDSPTEATL